MAVSRKQLLNALMPGLTKLFGVTYSKYTEPTIEYHARRTEADPKKWMVVRVTKTYMDEVTETKELATDLKRNRAQALVRLLRSNQQD
jgi:RNase P/RNase MRP subunit POP5